MARKKKQEFKYKTNFSSTIKCLIKDEENPYLSKASLEHIKEIIPDKYKTDEVLAADLLSIAANGAVVGYTNKNGDVIDKDLALQIYKYFNDKYLDLDHNADNIVGHIVNVGFSEFGTNKVLTEEEAKNLDVFNLVIAAVVYTAIPKNDKLIDILEESADPESDLYESISLSWEIGYNDFDIIVGPRDISKGSVISDEEQKAKYEKLLKANGGPGVDEEGNIISRKLKGMVLPMGFGLVTNPAAEVKGIVTAEEIQNKLENVDKVFESSSNDLKEALERIGSTAQEAGISIDALISFITKAKEVTGRDGVVIGNALKTLFTRLMSKDVRENLSKYGVTCDTDIVKCLDSVVLIYDEAKDEIKNSLAELLGGVYQFNVIKAIFGYKKDDEPKENISQSQVSNVKQNIIPVMNINSIDDISVVLASENVKAESIASVKSFIVDTLTQKSEEWSKNIKAKEDEVAAQKTKAEELEKQFNELKASNDKLQEELNKIKEEQEKVIAQEKFNSRMSEFDEEFDLDDDDRQILASDLKEIKDESYAAYKDKMGKLMKNKKKGLKKVDESKASDKSTASTQEEKDKAIDEALSKAKATDKNDVVVGDPAKESFKDRWLKEFKVTVNNKQFSIK